MQSWNCTASESYSPCHQIIFLSVFSGAKGIGPGSIVVIWCKVIMPSSGNKFLCLYVWFAAQDPMSDSTNRSKVCFSVKKLFVYPPKFFCKQTYISAYFRIPIWQIYVIIGISGQKFQTVLRQKKLFLLQVNIWLPHWILKNVGKVYVNASPFARYLSLLIFKETGIPFSDYQTVM